jgi:hypothetical protein
MADRSSASGLAVTRDHHHPKSKGGRKIVLACRTCNSIKGDMLPADWKAFMESFPAWWEHPEFRDIGWIDPKKYATTWDNAATFDKKGNPYRYNAPRPIRASKAETQRAFAEWQGRAMRERKNDAKRVPYEESKMILRHGKDYWRAWKDRGEPVCDCCRAPVPKAIPVEYSDPVAQAAFESVYTSRLHMLRVRG